MAGRDPEIHIKTSADTRDLDLLDKKMADTRRSMSDLAKQIARTDDAAKRAKLEKAFGDEQRALAKLRRVRRALEEVAAEARNADRALASVGGAGAGAAGRAGAAGGGLFGQAISSPVAPAVAGAALLAAPAIGAAVNAAILAGMGSGGLAAGIASAVRDPAVRQAFQPLRTEVIDLFDDLGVRFRQPVADVAGIWRRELAGVRDDWVAGIGDMSELVVPIARGLGGFGREASPGILNAITKSAPVLRAFAQELPGFGRDLDNMFDSLADGSEGAAEGLRFLINTMGDLARFTGQTIEVLSKLFDAMTDIATADKILAANLFGWWAPWLAEANQGIQFIKGMGATSAAAFDLMAGRAEAAKRPLAELNRKMNDIVQTGQDMRLATIDMKEALAEIGKAAQENGRSLDINSEKGRENLRILEAGITAANEMGEAATNRALAEGKSAEDAAAAGARIREHWIKELEAAARAAGFSAQKIREMVAEAKKADGTTIRTFLVRTEYREIVSRDEAMALRLGRRAEGGPVMAGMPYLVGERGPELMVPSTSGVVVPSAATKALGGGGRLQPIVLMLDSRVVWEGMVDLALTRGQTPLQLWPDSR